MSNEPTSRPKRGCAGVFFFFMLLVAAVGGAALGVFISILDDAKETITTLEDYRPKVGSKVYSADGELLAEFSIEDRQLMPLSEIPLHVQKAFIATEDHPFYTHKGVRPDAILRVAVRRARTGDMQGGSTITQQVVKNVEDLMVGKEVTYRRKIREAIVALQVEREFTKDEILELYLNQIFLGISAYGVEAAARQYFDKSIRDVTLGEAATLAGLTRSPNRNEPLHNFDNARTRRDIVLDQMLEQQFISLEERDLAVQEDLAASVVTAEERAERASKALLAHTKKYKAPYFVEEVRQFMFRRHGKEEVLEGGMDIKTTVDMRLQSAAERALTAGLDKFDEAKLASLTRAGKENEFHPVSGALVCLDNRNEYKGYVRALVGGRDFDKQKFNNATQALRQPGSSVKPFVWAAAIADGMTPSTHVLDGPYARMGANGKVWAPGNFDGKYHGSVPIRLALEKSLNTVSVRLVEKVGAPVVRSYLQRCGYRKPIDPAGGLTIGLGTAEVTPLDQTVSYSCFANGGMRYDPVFVTTVENRDGVVLYDSKEHALHEKAMDEAVAFVVAHMLTAVAEYGTGARTRPLDRPRAGKTGTTQDSRDVWFCGFTPDYTCVVWVGYADNQSLGRTSEFTGGRLAAPIWTEFMLAAEEGLPKREFDPPYGVEPFNIDRKTGYAGGSYREFYVKGTSPSSAQSVSLPDETEELTAGDTRPAAKPVQMVEPL